jgi:predicted ABC-type transport system involved in lysophospholipase L1 biosynthesis ATPase subunit
MGSMGHYGSMVQSGAPAGGNQHPASRLGIFTDGEPAVTSSGRGPGAAIDGPGAAIELSDVVCRSSVPGAGGDSSAAGVSLQVPPGQSLALLGQPLGTATGLLDVIAGLSRPRAGRVWVDGVAVDRLGGAELDRYRARRGLVSPRFPLLSSLSVTGNVLAVPPAGRAGGALGAERAVRLLEFVGAIRLAGPVRQLSAEDQWRIMIARALVSSPRLLLAEEPASGLDSRATDRVLDVLMDAHGAFGFTLVLTGSRLATAVRCQRRVFVAGGSVVEDEVISGDDGWTRSRVDRIG